MSATERAKTLVTRLFEAMVEVEGKSGVPLDVVQELVRDDPEAAATAVPALLKLGEQERGAYQIALAIARVYEDLHDDSLVLLVQQAIGSLKRPLSPLKYVQADEQGRYSGDTRHVSPPKVPILRVDPKDLEAGDVFPIVRLFKVDPDDPKPERTRGLRGRFILQFPLDQDPRPIWSIPSSRAYVAALYEQLPYFPYFLNPDPRASMFLAFFAPLADTDAIDGLKVDLGHASALRRVVASLEAVAWLARLVGDQPEPIVRSILEAAPVDFQSLVLGQVKGLR